MNLAKSILERIASASLEPQAMRAVRSVVSDFTFHLEHASAHLMRQAGREYGDAMAVYLEIVRDAAIEAAVGVARSESEIAARKEATRRVCSRCARDCAACTCVEDVISKGKGI